MITLNSEREKKLYGGILGLMAGDACGVPVEFSTRAERKADPVTDLREFGTHHQPKGTWSDDSSLMLCLVDAINSGYSAGTLAGKMIKYKKENYLTPYGFVFDIGIATSEAIDKMASGISPVKCGGDTERSNGNGSLMRILPAVFFLYSKSPSSIISVVEEMSSLTHAHATSVFACVFYVEMGILLYNGRTLQDAYKGAIDFMNSSQCDRFIDERERYERVMSGEIASAPEGSIRSTGYVLDSLEAALWCLLNTDNYKDCVLKAVNLGGDTDTIAAIAGGLAGITYSVEGIPSDWIDSLPRLKDILSMLNLFYNRIK